MNKQKRKELQERVVDNIMDNLYNYKDLVRIYVEFAVKQWAPIALLVELLLLQIAGAISFFTFSIAMLMVTIIIFLSSPKWLTY